MFRPTDSGLKFPLKWKNYQGRVFITSNDGRELFKMESVIYSLDGRAWLEEWAEWICNKSSITGEISEETYNKIGSKIIDNDMVKQLEQKDKEISELKEQIKKFSEKKIGRPKGSKNAK